MEDTKKSARGGAREGAGRPVSSDSGEKRDRNIGIRVTKSEAEMIRAKAASCGLGVTDFIVSLCRNA